MKIAPPPGVRTDQPPLNAEAFWYQAENVRFRLAEPQTVGLYARFLDRRTGEPVDDLFPDFLQEAEQVDFYADDNILIIASGRQMVFIRWTAGDVEVRTIEGVGVTGRWWFAATESEVIAGRSNLSGRAIAIDRKTLAITQIPNVPQGCLAGGILGGVLILAGTQSIGDTEPAMTVRWSARRTDPSSSGEPTGPFGFEDWIPSDVNASGEFRLENGSTIKAGGMTVFGFIVWTDTAAYEVTARTDLFVFAEDQISSRGILGPRTWITADDRVWWFDQTRTLNVYDGGRPRPIPSTIRNAALEVIEDADVARLSLSSDSENGEISLHYPGRDGVFRELVYNYREDAWYPFKLDRMNLTPANSPRPAIGMQADGQLMFYDLREVQTDFRVDETRQQSLYDGTTSPFQPSSTPEKFDYFLRSNRISAGNAAIQSWRSRTCVLSYTFAKSEFTPAVDDLVKLRVDSFGTLDLREDPVSDFHENPVGSMAFPLRVGGKSLQFTISGADQQTFLRFGMLDIEADEGGKR